MTTHRVIQGKRGLFFVLDEFFSKDRKVEETGACYTPVLLASLAGIEGIDLV